TGGAEIDGAQYASITRRRRWGFRRMGAGPNGAVHIVQQLGGHRAEKKTAELAISVRRHHDQVDALVTDVLFDAPGRLTFEHHARHGNILEFIGQEGLEVSLSLIPDCGEIRLEAVFGPSWVSRGWYFHYVQHGCAGFIAPGHAH